jgi:UDP-N-acetylglucosamine:LPS N-acetylglucosamine transferase
MKKKLKDRCLKVCVACSSGGHLAEALKATAQLDHDKYFVTFWTKNLKEFSEKNKVYCLTHPRHNPFRLLRNCIEAFVLLLREKPDLIISTGADVAVSTCVLGKLMRIKIIYIESGGYVSKPSISGRLVYPFADLFIVQWKPTIKNYPKAVYGGPLF